MNSIQIPENFIHWAYHERAQLIKRQAEGEEIQPQEIFLGFSRHKPAIVSSGPAGLNASIKGVGFIPKNVYHRPNPDGWKDRPAYIFVIEEIFDNSVTPQGFGKKGFGLL